MGECSRSSSDSSSAMSLIFSMTAVSGNRAAGSSDVAGSYDVAESVRVAGVACTSGVVGMAWASGEAPALAGCCMECSWEVFPGGAGESLAAILRSRSPWRAQVGARCPLTWHREQKSRRRPGQWATLCPVFLQKLH